MAKAKSKVARLKAAKIVDPKDLSDDEKQVLEGLSDEEVDALVKLRKKCGKASRHEARPNVIV
ncbi:MAG: hypothetical protein U0166_23945 [Acidobacteriota bacterium]